MKYPLIDMQLLLSLRVVHAVFNLSIVLAFLYHGQMGFSIRRARLSGEQLPFPLIKRHRALGPVLALLGMLGFFIGLTLVLLHTGNPLEYPLHFTTGAIIVLLLASTFLVSRRIKGRDSPYRKPHYILGIAILILYCLEVFLGIGVLF